MSEICQNPFAPEIGELKEISHLEKEIKRLKEHLISQNDQFEKDLQILFEENNVQRAENSQKDTQIRELIQELETERTNSNWKTEKDALLRAMELLEISKSLF
jgi:hypothetical protein